MAAQEGMIAEPVLKDLAAERAEVILDLQGHFGGLTDDITGEHVEFEVKPDTLFGGRLMVTEERTPHGLDDPESREPVRHLPLKGWLAQLHKRNNNGRGAVSADDLLVETLAIEQAYDDRERAAA